MTPATLSARFATEGLPGELAPIAARLNELLARLEDSFERERRFSSDVAHEFRTPVAELRSLAELAIKLPDTRAADADHETLAIALHLESILTHLLALARGEAGGLPVQRERVELAALLQNVCDPFREKARARELDFQRQRSGQRAGGNGPGAAALHSEKSRGQRRRLHAARRRGGGGSRRRQWPPGIARDEHHGRPSRSVICRTCSSDSGAKTPRGRPTGTRAWDFHWRGSLPKRSAANSLLVLPGQRGWC